MGQEDLKEYLEVHDCYVYRQKDDDHGRRYFMRKNGTKDMAVVIQPKNGVYKPATVCHICNLLSVPVPEFGIHMQPVIDEAKANCPKDWDEAMAMHKAADQSENEEGAA